MIGSASACRSYGFTHGSMLPQPLSATTAAAPLTANCQPLTAFIVLLFEQGSNLIQVLAFVARLVAAMQVTHVALAVDEHGARHRAHLVHRTHLALAVEQHRERHRRLAQPVLGAPDVGVGVA